MPITKSDLLAQRIADDLVRTGTFSDRSDAMRHAKASIGELRESFTQKLPDKVTKKHGINMSQSQQTAERWKRSFQTAHNNFSSTDRAMKARANSQYRILLQELNKAPNIVQSDPDIQRYKGVAERNTGYKGPAKPGTTPKQQGLQYGKNIDVTETQRKGGMQAKQKQWETKTNKTAGTRPQEVKPEIKSAKAGSVPPSQAPSKQGKMLQKADLFDKSGVAEAKYEKELMETAKKGGQKAVKQKFRIDTKQKMPEGLWKKISKALQGVRVGGGLGKGGRPRANNLLRKGNNNNDLIEL